MRAFLVAFLMLVTSLTSAASYAPVNAQKGPWSAIDTPHDCMRVPTPAMGAEASTALIADPTWLPDVQICVGSDVYQFTGHYLCASAHQSSRTL